MRAYFIRRFLLIPPTLLGVTILVFIVTRAAPGGPLERAIMEAQMADAQTGSASGMAGQDQALSEEQLQQLKEYYGFDKPWVVAYGHWLWSLMQGDLGNSFRFNEPVWEVIKPRFRISITYGLITLVVVYSVCIPLGVLKAIKHRTTIDSASSVLVFVGYSIPGYALGAILLTFLAAGQPFEWFPMSGFKSRYHDELSNWEQIVDLAHHAVLPVLCYVLGSFAFLTLLMKNHLLDNLAADYMRTAVSKGVAFRKAVIGHAFRNSLIPIATNFGQNIILIVGGSFLIETIFDINGFGLLGITAIFDRDVPVVMGVFFLSALLLLIGNIISDFLVALIDPRIRFS